MCSHRVVEAILTSMAKKTNRPCLKCAYDSVQLKSVKIKYLSPNIKKRKTKQEEASAQNDTRSGHDDRGCQPYLSEPTVFVLLR